MHWKNSNVLEVYKGRRGFIAPSTYLCASPYEKLEKRKMSYSTKQDDLILASPLNAVARPDYEERIVAALRWRRNLLNSALAQFATQAASMAEVATWLIGTLRNGNKVFVAGNGGSAAEAQHFAAELVGRFKRERSPYAVLSLTTDTSILTAIANDYGYQEVFARQVVGLSQPGDLLVTFS